MERPESGVYKLLGVVRNYDWGGTEFLSKLLSCPNSEDNTMAEYWLGAHQMDSSVVVTENGEASLKEFIAADTENILGKTVAKKFGRLPYLLKILDVRGMLSIQVHPAKHEAEMEFARENKERIPLDAPHRNYKDNNHKPELAVALAEFWLLHGFKPVPKLRSTLESIPEFSQLLEIFNSSGYDQMYKTVMEMPQESVNQLLQPLLDRVTPLYAKNALKKSDEDFWAARAALTFNQNPAMVRSGQCAIDRGIFSIYFFNLLHLKEGEGIFQNAGVPHSYLEGQNVEIMANSDNVLRGGLTNKHVDVKELMKHIRFEQTTPEIIRPQKIGSCEELYKTVAPDFKLSRITLKQDSTYSFESITGEILLLIKGQISIGSGESQLLLNGGEAAFILSHRHISLNSLSDAEVYRASVPVHSGE
ncbi:MAG TPA: mannose-6-phosphate isomerase, class I [Chitinophagaceae bacterium]|nr:mannose-6-phosphate isomerase, class I [Chitinophagaceae bacterium]